MGQSSLFLILRILLEDSMIFNIDKETMPREEIRKIQLERLQDLCRRV